MSLVKVLAGMACGGLLTIAVIWVWLVRSFSKGPF